jgi:DNA polymerase/3'-5' exonuclease PolX
MTLSFADKCVEKLLPWLRGISVKAEVAGSVRRRRPEVNDLDFVCVPLLKIESDLLGNIAGMKDETADAIRERIKSEAWAPIKDGPSYFQWIAKGVQVDVWLVDPPTFISNLICRTGSKEHNILMAERARKMGKEWRSTKGIYSRGELLRLETESEFYHALNLPLIAPEEREGTIVQRIINERDN